PVVGLVELAAQLYVENRAPAFDAYDALLAPIRERRRPGELVVMAPAWADPAARRVLGDEIMSMRDEARPDPSRYASALEISILGQRAKELDGWRETERFEVGKFTVRRLENSSQAHPTFDFADAAHPPVADVRLTGAVVADCIWNPNAPLEQSGWFGYPIWAA